MNILIYITIALVILAISLIGYTYWEKAKQDKNWGYLEKEWHDKDEL